MEIDCVNKRSLLKPNIFSSKLLIVTDKIKLTFDNSKNIFSLNKAKLSSKTFDLRFKDSFGFSPPGISRFNSTKNSTALWVRKNSYIIISNVTINKLISVLKLLVIVIVDILNSDGVNFILYICYLKNFIIL